MTNIENDLTSNYEDDKLIICYKEGALDVKDICVDEGIPHGERILFDENDNMMLKPELLKVSTMEDYYMESNVCSEINGKIDTGLTVPQSSNDHTNIEDKCHEVIERKSDASSETRGVVAGLTVNEPINDQELQHSTPVSNECGTNEEVVDSVAPNELKEMSKDDISNVDGLSGEEKINSSGISSLKQDRRLPSLKSLLESDRQPCQSPVEKVSERPVENKSTMEENTTLNLTKTEPATSTGVHKMENLEHVDELSIESHDTPELQDAGGEGESSFLIADPTSGLVTYSGHTGSTSLRSDSSTTSTRSFAFPILQNEWNSSPVRMAKADRSRLHKHRGWRHGLLCCRF